MINTQNGATIEAHPPVYAISVNKHRVAFTDSERLKRVDFNNLRETKQFIDWLIQL